jgi:uncharacterized membrane protein YphA (DoxX/SURF4 family)
MQTFWVLLVFAAAVLSALTLLYFFHARWYWHVLSLVAAMAAGLTPPPENWRPPDLLVGFVFLFLLLWGAGAPLFWKRHREEARSLELSRRHIRQSTER